MGCEIQKSRAKVLGGQNSAGSIVVRSLRPADTEAWLQMREALWPGAGLETQGVNETVLVAERDGALTGFVELSLRAYAEGCESSPVAYLEGWFVSPGARGTGVGRALIQAAEAWGRAQGCSEFASDTEAKNESSADAHRACGFEDVSVVRCFRKQL